MNNAVKLLMRLMTFQQLQQEQQNLQWSGRRAWRDEWLNMKSQTYPELFENEWKESNSKIKIIEAGRMLDGVHSRDRERWLMMQKSMLKGMATHVKATLEGGKGGDGGDLAAHKEEEEEATTLEGGEGGDGGSEQSMNPIKMVSCGGIDKETCAKCVPEHLKPFDLGSNHCHGDCKWEDDALGKGKCVLKTEV